MKWIPVALVLAIMTVAGCGRPPPNPEPTPPLADAPAAGIQSFAGKTYEVFTSETAFNRYSITALGANEATRERFIHSMANPAVGVLVSGGGSQALVFSGCAASGCLEGLSVVAIDTQTGEVFAAVSDMAGQERIAENERLEALLRLTSPSQSWDDPVRPPANR